MGSIRLKEIYTGCAAEINFDPFLQFDYEISEPNQ